MSTLIDFSLSIIDLKNAYEIGRTIINTPIIDKTTIIVLLPTIISIHV